MPDNKENRVIDEQFTDFAWGEMSKLLDQEMPIASPSKKRRFLLLLLLLGLVLGGLVTALGVQNEWGAPQSEPVKPTKPVAIIQNQKVISESTADCVEVAEKQTTFTELVPPATANYNQNNSAHDLKAEYITQPIVPVPKTDEITNVQNIDQVETLPSNPIIVKDTEDTPRDMPLKSLMELTPLDGKLANLEYASLSEEQLTLPKAKKKSGFAKAISPSRWGVEGGALSTQLSELDGLHLGLSAKYDLGSSRWDIHTGIAYAVQNQPFRYGSWNNKSSLGTQAGAYNPNFDIENNFQDTTIISPVTDPGTGLNFELDSIATSFAATFQRLELPAMVSFQADERLGIDFGAHFAYILAARPSATGNNSLLADALEFANFSRADANSSSGTNSSFSAQSVNRFGVLLRGGVSYYPTKKLGLRFHYQFGPFNASKSARYYSYNRAFRISTVFYF